jgi:ABC-type branched-subunit amino acid transport system substrate-binding protein
LTRLAALAAVLAVALAGCGDVDRTIRGGGTVGGETLTVYSLLPQPGLGTPKDIVDGQKLALFDAGGKAGEYAINFIAIDEGRPGGEDGAVEAAVPLRDALKDPQITALIGPLGSDTAMAAVPLFNGAGVLEVTPGAGYPGFTEPLGPGEPERWQVGGRDTLARLAGDDIAQAPALLAAAGGRDKRVAIEQEPGPVADAMVAALRDAGARIAEDPAAADAVVYAGEDPVNAAGVADGLAREAPDATIVLPDALTRAGVAGRLSPAARRRAVLVSSAPEPGSTPALREFEARFRETYGRAPGPYAAVGYESMRSVLAAVGRAGERAGSRQAVLEAYLDGTPRTGTLLGDYAIAADGRVDPARWTAFRFTRGGREYLPLGPG